MRITQLGGAGGGGGGRQQKACFRYMLMDRRRALSISCVASDASDASDASVSCPAWTPAIRESRHSQSNDFEGQVQCTGAVGKIAAVPMNTVAQLRKIDESRYCSHS